MSNSYRGRDRRPKNNTRRNENHAHAHAPWKVSKKHVSSPIGNLSLYGEERKEDIAKHHLKDTTTIIINDGKLMPNGKPSSRKVDIIKGEEEMGMQPCNVGGIIITTESIGAVYCDTFNELQQQHLKDGTLAHKALCERRNEATALLFVRYQDLVAGMVGEMEDMNKKSLCDTVRRNVQTIISDRLEWLVNHSIAVIEDYYGLQKEDFKITLNYILDDGNYDENVQASMIYQFLKELRYYEKQYIRIDNGVGAICQVLAPMGAPSKRLWCQMDLGISFVGRRLYKEDIEVAAVRRAGEDIRAIVSENIIINASIINKLLFVPPRSTTEYDGYQIFIWEVFFADQLKMYAERALNLSVFCKCAERRAVIERMKLSAARASGET